MAPDNGGAMVKRWTDKAGVHLDLRGLEPPEPMVAILGEIDGGTARRVTAYMDREPIFLYPELDERGWTSSVCFAGQADAPSAVADGVPAVVVVFSQEDGI